MPNMASTPSALRHSMIASTALIYVRVGRQILASRRGHLLGPFLVSTASVADLLIERHHVSALVAVAIDLVALVAPQQCSDVPDDRNHEADREPEHERAALVAPGQTRAEAAAQADEDVTETRHGADLEDSDRPDDRDYRDYYDDRGGERRHDPDHDLEQEPGSDDEDENGQH